MKRTRKPYKRKNIKKQDIHLDIIEKNDSLLVKIKIQNLSSYNFPGDAKIFLEAYNKLEMDSIDLGKIDDFSEKEIEKQLSFKKSQRVKINFRLKVVNTKTWHLLGLAEKLKEKKYANSLLTITTEEDLHSVYKFNWDNIDLPSLKVNKDFEKLTDIKPSIVASVFKEILISLLFFGWIDDDEDFENHKWIQFAQKICHKENVSSLSVEEKREWIDDVVEEFSKEQKIMKKLIKNLSMDL